MEGGAAFSGKGNGGAGDENPTPSTNYSRKALNFQIMKNARSYEVECSRLEEFSLEHVPRLKTSHTDVVSESESEFE